jgi:tripartite motif-containing protein 71
MQKENFSFSIFMIMIFVLSTSFFVIMHSPGISMAQAVSSSHPFVSYQYLKQWGSKGSAFGQFLTPNGIVVDSSGNVYVTDTGNSRIQKFDSNGNFITKWDFVSPDAGQIVRPEGLAVDSSGHVYVSDNGNSRIQKFDSNGNFITKWNFKDPTNGQFVSPEGLAVDSSGHVYVTNYNSNMVIKFDSNGNFITKWRANNPEDIAVDSIGNVYVTDYTGVLKFDSNGNLITKWGSSGSGNGQFIGSGAIAIDSSGHVYVADSGNNRIEVFAPVIHSMISNKIHSENKTFPDNAPSNKGNKFFSQSGISDQV